MIRGDKIKLRMYRDEREFRECLELYNDVAARAVHDHSEIFSLNSRLGSFQQNGAWSSERGTLLIITDDEQKVGDISFHRSTELELQIGYRIWRLDDRGKGYMSAALPLFSAYLFATIPQITRLSLLTAIDNAASCRLAEKSGYQREGVLRQAYFYRGRIVDWVVYGLLRAEAPDLSSQLAME